MKKTQLSYLIHNTVYAILCLYRESTRTKERKATSPYSPLLPPSPPFPNTQQTFYLKPPSALFILPLFFHFSSISYLLLIYFTIISPVFSSSNNIMTPQSSTEQFSLLTFNLLAPCYKRMFGPSGQERRDRECDHSALWSERLDSILHFLTTVSPTPHVISLQEFWFHPSFKQRVEDALSPKYHMFYAKRPGTKEDGLATLVLRNSPFIRNVKQVGSFPLGNADRVALAIHATLTSSDSESAPATSSSLLILNAHLTFPHCFISRCLRESQADALTTFVNTYAAANPAEQVSALVVGDFNSDMRSSVCARMSDAHYVNCFAALNGPSALAVTHLNHLHEEVFTDHVFLRQFPAAAVEADQASKKSLTGRRKRSVSQERGEGSSRSVSPSPQAVRRMYEKEMALQSGKKAAGQRCSIGPVSCTVYPENVSPDVWPSREEFAISDHRPVGIVFDVTCRYDAN